MSATRIVSSSRTGGTSLRVLVNTWLGGAFALAFLLIATFGWGAASDRAHRQLLSDAQAAMASVQATLDYNQAQVTPLLSGVSSTQFLPESVPFFAAGRQFALRSEGTGMALRQTALNPTNPSDSPTPDERTLIDRFLHDPALASTTESADGRFLYAVPNRVTDPGCLSCHSDPLVAPKPMVDVFGNKNGFNWQLNQTVGAEIVSLPEASALSAAHASWFWRMAGVLLLLLLLLGAVNLVLDRLVLAPLRRVAVTAEAASLGEPAAASFSAEAEAAGEVGTVARAFERMRRSLVTAAAMLDG